MDLDSWSAQVTERQELDRPPAPLTTDWEAARDSVERLSGLYPSIIAAGHGVPIAYHEVGERLIDLAAHLDSPPAGRYAAQPAVTDETGVVSVPPPPPDPLPLYLAIVAAAAALTAAALYEKRHHQEARY
jgi:hypothetical protein